MVNPYICYALAFSIALTMYPLGWSTLYPSLSLGLVLFIVCTIALHLVAGLILKRKNTIAFTTLDSRYSKTAAVRVTLFLYALWCLEFLYAGGVPLLEILMRHPFDYKVFGIPRLHVFIVTFSSFYTILLFHHYLSSRSRLMLVLYLINLGAAILIYNRGMFLFNVAASLFLVLINQRKVNMAHLGAGILGVVAIAFLFGVMGSLRVSNESRTPYSNEGFLDTGHAAESFRASPIPDEFFWTYIYTTSPLANLEENMTASVPSTIRTATLLQWFSNELLPDFISKRINEETGTDRKKISTIPGPFNATTVYAGSFSYLGWGGLLLMALAILLVPPIYFRMVPAASPFFLSGVAILNTMFLFMIFDNTIRFTGLSLQMAYPVLLNLCMLRFAWVKRIFL